MLTMDRSGTIQWDVYTLTPETTLAAFEQQLIERNPTTEPAQLLPEPDEDMTGPMHAVPGIFSAMGQALTPGRNVRAEQEVAVAQRKARRTVMLPIERATIGDVEGILRASLVFTEAKPDILRLYPVFSVGYAGAHAANHTQINALLRTMLGEPTASKPVQIQGSRGADVTYRFAWGRVFNQWDADEYDGRNACSITEIRFANPSPFSTENWSETLRKVSGV